MISTCNIKNNIKCIIKFFYELIKHLIASILFIIIFFPGLILYACGDPCMQDYQRNNRRISIIYPSNELVSSSITNINLKKELFKNKIKGIVIDRINNYNWTRSSDEIIIKNVINELINQIDNQIDKDSKNCSICLKNIYEDEVEILLNCSHFYHEDCLYKWYECNKQTCPCCRQVFI